MKSQRANCNLNGKNRQTDRPTGRQIDIGCLFESCADRGFTSACTHTFKDEYTREIVHKMLACACTRTNIKAHTHAAEATIVLLVGKRATHYFGNEKQKFDYCCVLSLL